MGIIDMTDDKFAEDVIKALLRHRPMTEDEITGALKEAQEYRVGACMIEMLLEGRVDANWNGEHLAFVNPK